MRKRSEVKKPATESTVSEPTIKETSEKLRDALRAGAGVPVLVKFESANEAREVPLAAAFETITERIFVEDPLPVYEKLERALRVGEHRSDHGEVNKALDYAETNARLAHRLYVTAQVEYERWKLDNEVVFAAMRRQATETLHREKTQGYRAKQITDADVNSMCATLFPDEFRAQEVRKKKVEMMRDSMKNLVEVWLSRCKSLQTMLAKQR